MDKQASGKRLTIKQHAELAHSSESTVKRSRRAEKYGYGDRILKGEITVGEADREIRERLGGMTTPPPGRVREIVLELLDIADRGDLERLQYISANLDQISPWLAAGRKKRGQKRPQEGS